LKGSQPSKNAVLGATIAASSIIALTFCLMALGFIVCLCQKHRMKTEVVKALDVSL